MEKAHELGVRRLWGRVDSNDARSLRFLKLQGFREVRRQWVAFLDLVPGTLSRVRDRKAELEAEGVTFTSWAQEGAEDPAVFRRLSELFLELYSDAPQQGIYSSDHFRPVAERIMRSPDMLPDGFFIARLGGEYVGLSCVALNRRAPGVLDQLFTGVLRGVRGRGVATQLKRYVIDFGIHHGFRRIRTNNDSENRGMWAINERLGFSREKEWILGERVLS